MKIAPEEVVSETGYKKETEPILPTLPKVLPEESSKVESSTTVSDSRTRHLFADKSALKIVLEEQNRLLGIVKIPGATARQAREAILADGVDPNENIFSEGIISARED